MTFQPIVPMGGLTGWTFLQRSYARQSEVFNQSASIQRDTEYFAENIRKIDTPEQLVSDRRLLQVALGAFGLQDDINNRYFIQKMLEEGSFDPQSLSNRLSDSRYKDLVKAFGFGDLGVPNTKLSTFPDEIIAAYQTRSFEVAIGQQNDTMRLALNAVRELEEMVADDVSDTAKWYQIMGTPPLRTVFETAFALPSSFGQIDLEQQLDVFRERAESFLGSGAVDQFSEPEAREKLVQRFLLMSQINEGAAAASQAPLLILFQ